MLDGSSIHFAGEIDEVRVSDIVRYPTIFFKPSATPFTTDSDTRGLWHFDEGAGTTAADASGNQNNGTLMGGVGWATDSPVGGPSTPPVITNVATTAVQSGTATITWTTDRPAASQVEYGPAPGFGLRSPKDSSLVLTHSVKLGGLLPNTTYNYQAVSTDAFGNAVPSANLSFTTTDPSKSPLGEWSAAMNWPEVAVHAALLYTGDVIAWDAFESPGTPSVRLWHPSTETFTPVPNLVSQIFCSGMAALADGRLLVVGGHNGEETGITDTNIFDPATSTWTPAPKMAQARWYPSATELADGRVLAFSGQITPGDFANQPEIYTPATNSWSSLASVDTSDFETDQYPLSYQLPNGKFFTLAPEVRYRSLPGCRRADLYPRAAEFNAGDVWLGGDVPTGQAALQRRWPPAGVGELRDRRRGRRPDPDHARLAPDQADGHGANIPQPADAAGWQSPDDRRRRPRGRGCQWHLTTCRRELGPEHRDLDNAGRGARSAAVPLDGVVAAGRPRAGRRRGPLRHEPGLLLGRNLFAAVPVQRPAADDHQRTRQ